jgi:hypothetical protein
MPPSKWKKSPARSKNAGWTALHATDFLVAARSRGRNTGTEIRLKYWRTAGERPVNPAFWLDLLKLVSIFMNTGVDGSVFAAQMDVPHDGDCEWMPTQFGPGRRRTWHQLEPDAGALTLFGWLSGVWGGAAVTTSRAMDWGADPCGSSRASICPAEGLRRVRCALACPAFPCNTVLRKINYYNSE